MIVHAKSEEGSVPLGVIRGRGVNRASVGDQQVQIDGSDCRIFRGRSSAAQQDCEGLSSFVDCRLVYVVMPCYDEEARL